MSIVKLAPDTSVIMTVTGTFDDVSQSNGGAQVKYKGHAADDADAVIYLSGGNSERQLALLNLTRESVIGRTVEFVAKRKGAQKFIDMRWPLNVQGTLPGVATSPAAAATPAPVRAAAALKAKQEFSAGPALPNEPGYVAPSAPTAPPPDADAVRAAKREAWERTKTGFDVCVDHALKVHAAKLSHIPITHDGIAIMAAALFTSCTTRGRAT